MGMNCDAFLRSRCNCIISSFFVVSLFFVSLFVLSLVFGAAIVSPLGGSIGFFRISVGNGSPTTTIRCRCSCNFFLSSFDTGLVNFKVHCTPRFREFRFRVLFVVVGKFPISIPRFFKFPFRVIVCTIGFVCNNSVDGCVVVMLGVAEFVSMVAVVEVDTAVDTAVTSESTSMCCIDASLLLLLLLLLLLVGGLILVSFSVFVVFFLRNVVVTSPLVDVVAFVLVLILVDFFLSRRVTTVAVATSTLVATVENI